MLFKKLEEFTCLLAYSIGIRELPGWRSLQVCPAWGLCSDGHQGHRFQRRTSLVLGEVREFLHPVRASRWTREDSRGAERVLLLLSLFLFF